MAVAPLSFRSSSPDGKGVKRTVVTRRASSVTRPAAADAAAAPVAPPAAPPPAGVPVDRLPALLEEWIIYGEYRGMSDATLSNRRLVCSKFIERLRALGFTVCDRGAVQKWTASIRDSGGLSGKAAGKEKDVRPQTVLSYFAVLRAWFNYLVKQHLIAASPCDGLEPPKAPQDQIKPFTDAQALLLIEAAKRTSNKTRRRDVAIVSLLLETGIRASELVSLRRKDVDLGQHHLTVFGKGGKFRTVPFGLETKAALTRWIIDAQPGDDDPLFVGTRGEEAGEALTRWGLLQLLERLGERAGIEGVRVSPHTCRHYAAVTYIRNDADAFTVKTLLGHKSVKQTDRYVELGQAALDRKVRKHSPLDNLKRARTQGRG